MKAECFKMLDDRPQTKVQTLMLETGVTKGTGYSYRSYHKRLREEEKRQKRRPSGSGGTDDLGGSACVCAGVGSP